MIFAAGVLHHVNMLGEMEVYGTNGSSGMVDRDGCCARL